MRLCIIPARGGSKRIPRKNIKTFGGRPMIEWSIKVALQSECFDRVVVSTDDSEISHVAVACGADVPFLRPVGLSDDQTATTPVIAHAIEWQNSNGEQVTEACCLYATAPFVKSEDLRVGLEKLLVGDAEYVFSLTSFPYPIQRALRINSHQRVEMFQPEHFNTRSQDLPEAWHDAGQFYWGTANAWLSHTPIFGACSSAVQIPRWRVQDIDTPEDWKRAELMFNCLNQIPEGL
jgi:pseudaminic acid cytidylyltransferase